jgi:hypothetical protein
MGNSNWSVSNGYWGMDLSDSDGWALTVNNSVESVDWVGSVGNGTDGTIGLNKGVLSLDNATITGLVVRVLVTGEGVRDGVSEVVLWMRVEGLSSNSLDYWSSDSLSDKWSGMDSVGDWCVCWSISSGGICWLSISCWSICLGISLMSNRGSVGWSISLLHGVNGWSSNSMMNWSSDSVGDLEIRQSLAKFRWNLCRG